MGNTEPQSSTWSAGRSCRGGSPGRSGSRTGSLRGRVQGEQTQTGAAEFRSAGTGALVSQCCGRCSPAQPSEVRAGSVRVEIWENGGAGNMQCGVSDRRSTAACRRGSWCRSARRPPASTSRPAAVRSFAQAAASCVEMRESGGLGNIMEQRRRSSPASTRTRRTRSARRRPGRTTPTAAPSRTGSLRAHTCAARARQQETRGGRA